MTRTIQTTLAGEVTVEPTGWRHTVAVVIGGTTHTFTATEAASIALALQVAVADTFGAPQADSITSVRSANVRRTKADLVEDSFIMDEAVMVEPQPSRDFLVTVMGTSPRRSKAVLVDDAFADDMMSAF